MNHRSRGGIVIWILMLCLLTAPVTAQEAETGEQPPSVQEEVVPAQMQAAEPAGQDAGDSVPQAAILGRADEVAATLRRLERLLEQSDYLEQLGADVDAQAARLVQLEAELDELENRPVSLARIADLEAALLRAEAANEFRAGDIEEKWTLLRTELQRLVDARDLWTRTRAVAERDDYPVELQGRVARTLTDLDAMLARLEFVNAEAAAMADRISRQGETIVSAFDRTEAMAARLSRGLGDRSESRFFQLADPAGAETAGADIAEATGYWWGSLTGYLEGREGSLYTAAAIFLFLLAAAVVLLRLSRSWPREDEALAAARLVVGRPVAVAIVFTAVCNAFVFDEPVRAMQDAVVLLAIVALLRLGPLLLHPSLHGVLYAFTLIYLVNLPWQLMPAQSALGQWMLAAGIVAAIVCVGVVLARFGSAREALGTRSWQIARAGLVLAEVGFVLAFLAGGLGWLRLTRFLTAGFVAAVFGAIAWRVIYKAAVAVLPFLVRAPLAHVREGSRRKEPVLRNFAALLIGLFVTWRYLRNVLDDFRLLQPVQRWLEETLDATYAWGGLELSVGSVLAAVLVLMVTPIVARVVRFVLSEEVAPRLGMAPGIAYSVTTLSGYFVWVIGLAAAANAAGVSGTQMTVLFGALGVGLGFGLQAVVNNFVSGLILMFERPLKVGDRIQTATHAGTVTAIGIRSSTIRTWAGADVVVPNGDLVTKEVINWTLSDDIRRVEVKISTSYDAKPRRVLEILDGIARSHSKVLAEPAPAAIMHSFGDTALNFELRTWVEAADFVSVGSELHILVEEALTEAGISLVVPRRELLVRNEADQSGDDTGGGD